MAVDRRLLKLHEALRRCSAQPPGRIVTMVARVTPAFGVGIRDLPALDRGAGIPGGTVLPTWIDGSGALEIVTWNTGEASDLRRYGNRSHAEAQWASLRAPVIPLRTDQPVALQVGDNWKIGP